MTNDREREAKMAREAIDNCARFIETTELYLRESRERIDPASRLFLENSIVLLSAMLTMIRVLSCKVLVDAKRAEELQALNKELKEHLV